MVDPQEYVNDGGSSASIDWGSLGGLTLRGIGYAIVLSSIRIVLTLVQAVQDGTAHVARRIGGAVSMLTSPSIFRTGAETTIANLPDEGAFIISLVLVFVALMAADTLLEVP